MTSRTRKWLSLSVSAAMLLAFAGCGGQTDGGAGSAGAGSSGSVQGGAPEGGAAAAAQWAEENGLNKTETPEELYLKAKDEKKVVVYSISSRMKKVKESFEAKYPDVECETYDIDQNALFEKISREYEAGLRNADVVHCKEMTGGLYNEFIKPGIFHAYRPEDIVSTIGNKKALERYLPMYYEMAWWYYNDEVFTDGSPIKSWWDATDPKWKGRIMMADPQQDESYMALFALMMKNSDMLAEDYKNVTGKELELSPGCENAGQELLKRLMDNTPIFDTSSGKVVESIGTRGQQTPPIGYCSSVKLRERKDQDWALMNIPDTTPVCGTYGMNTLNIVNEAPHPAAAKLLVRWIMGEADGQGEGFVPFNTIGGWSSRSNVPLAEGNPELDSVPVFESDYDYIYENLQATQDFWLSIQP